MEVRLHVASGRAKGRVVPLPGTVFLIGRGKQCHLRPHCRQVSKLHCAIACWAGKAAVRDLKSRNGTFLNGVSVHGEARLSDGDALRVGSLEFTVRISPTEQLPVAIVREQDVRWLVDSDDQTPALGAPGTLVAEDESLVPAGGLSVDSSAASTGDLSAGDLLRDYLRTRRAQ